MVNQNSVQLENGEAVLLEPSTNGGFVSSGQVIGDDVEVKGDGSGKVFRCNCTPVQITLGEIAPNENFSQDGGEAITFLNPIGGVKNKYVYLGEGVIEELHNAFDELYAETTVGWYLEDAWTAFQDWLSDGGEAPALVNQNDLVTLKSGAGLMFEPSANGGLIIPSPL